MRHLDKMRRKKLGELLIDEGLVTSDQVVEALKEQKRCGDPIGEILISFDVVSEWDIARTLAKQFQLPFIHASKYSISLEVQELIPPEILHRYKCVPLDRFDNILTVAVAGLLNEKMVEELESISGCELFLYVGLPSEVRNTLNQEFPLDGTMKDLQEMQDMEKGVKLTSAEVESELEAAASGEWERLFDVANESVLNEINPEDSD